MTQTTIRPRSRHLRHHARVPLSGVTVTVAQAPEASPRVINISSGGLLLDDVELEPGVGVEFILESPALSGAGAGRVAHSRRGVTGIAVRRWDDGLDAVIDELVERALLANSTWRELYGAPPRCRPVRE